MDRDEVAYAIIEPYYDAARDVFAEYVTDDGAALDKVRRTKLVVNDSVRDSPRHYAGCRDDGLLIVMAPEAAELDVDTLMAIICHELGHAVDFLYPASWLGYRHKPAVWIPADAPKQGRIRNAWAERNDAQVEWSADSIAHAVTGKRITYCGPCMLQCFSGGQLRPAALV